MIEPINGDGDGDALAAVIEERIDLMAPTAASGRSVDPRVWTFAGVGMLAAGCVLLAVAWGLAAGQTQVSLQIPYVMSAGFPGVALVVVGIGLVVVGARETDARARRRQQQELIGLLVVLRDELKAVESVPAAPIARARRSRKAAG
jgi:hypothetical protein